MSSGVVTAIITPDQVRDVIQMLEQPLPAIGGMYDRDRPKGVGRRGAWLC